MKVAWGVAETTMREVVAKLGHDLHVFRVCGPWEDGIGRTARRVDCKRCGKFFYLVFCKIHAFHIKPADLHGECKPKFSRPLAA